MSESYERFLPVRSYPWISIGILGLIAGLGVYDEYFAPNASNSSQIQTNNSSLSVGALVLGLAITWAIILTPVIAASQKLRSFIKLFNFRFQWVDLAWGVGLLTANLILSYLW